MRARFSVARAASPAVAAIDCDVIVAHIYHRFNCERVARTKQYAASRGAEIRNIRLFVDVTTDTVTRHNANNRKAVAFDVGLNGVAYVAEPFTRSRLRDSFKETFARDVDKALFFGGDFTYRKSPRRVAVEAAVSRSDVDTYDFALFEPAIRGNTVDYHVVDRDTGGIGKSVKMLVRWRLSSGFSTLALYSFSSFILPSI